MATCSGTVRNRVKSADLTWISVVNGVIHSNDAVINDISLFNDTADARVKFLYFSNMKLLNVFDCVHVKWQGRSWLYHCCHFAVSGDNYNDVNDPTGNIVYTHIYNTLVYSLHGLLNCEIGGLDCHVITTEYRTRVHCKHMYHLLCTALVHVIYSGVSGQCSHTIPDCTDFYDNITVMSLLIMPKREWHIASLLSDKKENSYTSVDYPVIDAD